MTRSCSTRSDLSFTHSPFLFVPHPMFSQRSRYLSPHFTMRSSSLRYQLSKTHVYKDLSLLLENPGILHQPFPLLLSNGFLQQTLTISSKPKTNTWLLTRTLLATRRPCPSHTNSSMLLQWRMCQHYQSSLPALGSPSSCTPLRTSRTLRATMTSCGSSVME